MNVIAGTTLTNAASFSELLSLFNDPTTDSKVQDYYKSTNPDDGYAFTSESSFALLMADKKSLTHQVSEKLEVNNRSVQIGTANVYDTVVFQFESGLSVENGGLLFQNSSTANSAKYNQQNIKIVLGLPITVGSGGRLVLEGASMGAVGTGIPDGNIPKQSELIAPKNASAIQIQDGGQVDIVHFVVKRGDDDTSSAPLIEVASGAELNFLMGGDSLVGEDGLPVFAENTQNADKRAKVDLNNGSSDSPAVSVAENATVNLKAGDFSSENGTIFDLADGATLNLEGGTISNTGDKPAIHADSGATVILPENPDAIQITTSNENGQAIDLAGGSKVQKGDTTITVGADGDSYVDNDGSIILGAGSSVTDPNGTTELPNGGSVDQDGDVTQNALPAESISLNQTSVTLYSNTTPNTVQLIADVTPDNTTDSVAWSSDNEAVATVNESGLVTAVSNGSATITATAGNVSAACTVTVTTYTSGGGSSDDDSDPTYSVTLPKNVKGGEVKTSHRYAEQGNTVTITVDPDKGYELDELTVTDSKGKELDLTDKGNGKYTFKMPDTRVEVEVSFKLIETEPEAPAFADVPASAYYADAVAWAVEQGITSGTSTNTFSPDMSCTRAQIVTFLWRANGSPKADGANPFTDVSADAYYYDAVLWAVKEGITSGTSATTFSPDATVTRAQTVTFLYRAAGAPAVTGGSFADVAADAYYAGAVAWAVKEGVTSGTGGNNFSPDAPCTRGQIVTFMYRGVQ